MRLSSLRGGPEGGRRALTLLCVLLVFGAETVFAAALPLFGAALPYANAALVGLALSLSGGVGFLLLPFFVAWMDGDRLHSLMLVAGGAMILSCLLVREASGLGPAALLLGSLGFGVARIVGVVGLLAMVARLPGSPAANQGWNGGLQRLGSLLALLGSGVFFARGDWNGVFLLLIFVVALWGLLAYRSARFLAPPRQPQPAGVRRIRGRRASLSECVAALRGPGVRAAAALNVLNLLVLMHGNSFFSMAFAPRFDAVSLSSLVVVTVVLRDAVAVCGGVLFPVVLRRLGGRALLGVLGILAVLPFLLIGCVPGAVSVALLGAAAHGLMVGWGSATANLLAAGADPTGVGLRIAASQLPAGAVLLAAPLAFGGLVEGAGSLAAYGMLTAVAAGSVWVMMRASRGVDPAA